MFIRRVCDEILGSVFLLWIKNGSVVFLFCHDEVQFLIFVFFLSQIVSSASNLASWRNIITDAAKDEALAPNLVVRNLAILCIGAYECLNREDNQYSSIITFDAEKPSKYDSLSALRGCLFEICDFLHPSQRNRF